MHTLLPSSPHRRNKRGRNDTAKRKWKLSYGLRPAGKTTDGRLVVSGFDVFKLMETIGTPLELIIEKLYSENMLIDWIDFVDTGLSIGWTPQRIVFKIETGFVEADMDPEEIIGRIKKYLHRGVVR